MESCHLAQFQLQARLTLSKIVKDSYPKEVIMLFSKLFLASGLIAVGALYVEAADMETRLIDKNCWVEVFEDTKYDAKDPHVQLQGPQDYATLNNLNGKDWNNDIESVIVGSGATVRAYEERDFQGREIAFTSGQRVPNLSQLGMSNDIESLKITCGSSDAQNQPTGGSTSSKNSEQTGRPSSDRPSAPPSSKSTTTTTTTTTTAPAP